ncbi:MAG TPA: fumarylacetoacetate hydrolase family protein [Solirubrobacteraceae bacterium]
MRLVSFQAGDEVQVGELEDDRVRVLAAPTMVDWLAGEGRLQTRVEHGLEDVDLLAPVPFPPSVRDFFAFEEHVKVGMRLRGTEVPEAWYEAPTFYFSNPASIVGPDAEVRKPPATSLLDFELEIAAVIGPDQEIAAFTLLNDWSARDLQGREMTVGLGPAKGKAFATSLGPWLLTVDEVPLADGRVDLEATATINGTEVTRTWAGAQHFPWSELVAHAARDTRLRPGDVLGSGTLNRGCLLELGPLEGERGLEPGDTVALEAGPLGRLENRIV